MKRKSFTLLEMLVVITILFILIGLLGPAFSHAQGTGTLAKCMSRKKNIASSMIMYSNENNGLMIYKSCDKTYADVLNGGFNNIKSYLPNKELLCTLAKEETIGSDAEQATGMLNALSVAGRDSSSLSDDSGWLNGSSNYETDNKNYELLGRFARVPEQNSKGYDTNKDTVVYIVGRMKAPEDTLLFADTFTDKGDSYWSFIPDSDDNSARVTLVHKHVTATAFADGHASAMKRGDLDDSKTSVTKMYDEEFSAI